MFRKFSLLYVQVNVNCWAQISNFKLKHVWTFVSIDKPNRFICELTFTCKRKVYISVLINISFIKAFLYSSWLVPSFGIKHKNINKLLLGRKYFQFVFLSSKIKIKIRFGIASSYYGRHRYYYNRVLNKVLLKAYYQYNFVEQPYKNSKIMPNQKS